MRLKNALAKAAQDSVEDKIQAALTIPGLNMNLFAKTKVEVESEKSDDENETSEELTQETWQAWKFRVIEKVKAVGKQDKGHLLALLNTLLEINKTLGRNPDKQLLNEAEEFFSLVFKITYYSMQNPICNQPISQAQKPLRNSKILELIGAQEEIKVKINMVVNNILLHQIEQVG